MEDLIITRSTIHTAHEESYSDGRTIGVLINSDLDRDLEKIDSFIYLFREESKIYVFFETIVEMNDYILYGDKKVKKAYMKEDDFDNLYDNIVKGTFRDHLKWSQ